MPATVIHYTEVKSTISGPPAQYSVVVTVGVPTPNVNIDKYLFVYRYSDQLYDHVATVLDVSTYPTVTPNPLFPFYRVDTVTKLTENSAEAVDFSNMVKSRLTTLAKEYDLVASTFVPGTYPITVP